VKRSKCGGNDKQIEKAREKNSAHMRSRAFILVVERAKSQREKRGEERF
jgi:hypothetical protein